MAGVLEEKRNEKLDKPKQMGLIGELTFLKNYSHLSILDLHLMHGRDLINMQKIF